MFLNKLTFGLPKTEEAGGICHATCPDNVCVIAFAPFRTGLRSFIRLGPPWVLIFGIIRLIERRDAWRRMKTTRRVSPVCQVPAPSYIFAFNLSRILPSYSHTFQSLFKRDLKGSGLLSTVEL